jgi:hypothetical protein
MSLLCSKELNKRCKFLEDVFPQQSLVPYNKWNKSNFHLRNTRDDKFGITARSK